MKRFLTLGTIVILSVMFWNCKSDQKTIDSQMDTVIAVHDELMPKMTQIGVLRQKLLDAIPDSLVTQEQQKVMLDLKESNASMMQWMKDFGADFDFEEIAQGKPLSKEKMDLLDKYQASVNALKEQMLSSLQNGQQVFDDLKQ